MDKDAIARLRGLLEKARVKPLLLGGNPYQDAADVRTHKRLIEELQREALNALPALLSIAERAADVDGMARIAAASTGLDWDGKSKATEYANHGYWSPVATAVSRYVLGGE